MRNVIILLAMVAVLTTTSFAAITNPDGFESYTPGSWSPLVTDGWTNTTSTATITDTNGLGGSNGVLAGGYPTGGGIKWAGGNTAGGLQSFDFDFRVTTGTGTNTRWAVTAGGPSYGAFYLVANDYGSVIKLQHQEWVSGSYDTTPANFAYVSTPLPGAGVPSAAATWRDGNWHHITIEMDFSQNPNPLADTGIARARYDNNAWTAWVPMPDYRTWGSGTHTDAEYQVIDDFHNDGPDFYLDNVQWSAHYGLQNPEPFEVYDDTTNWQPSADLDGWTITDANAEIGSAYGETDKGLKLNDTAQGQWYATTIYDPCVYLSQTFTVDFKSTAASGGERIIVFSAGDADQGAFNVEFQNGTEHDAWLEHYNVTAASYDKIYLPDANNWTSGVWHTLTVEMDFATNTARAKLDDNGFTGWAYMPQDDTVAPGPAYSYANINTNAEAGTFNLDNYALSLPDAGYSNPEGFETYLLTDDWNPTEFGQGWTGTAAADLQISTDANALGGTQGLKAGRGGAIAAGQATWYVTADANFQTFDVDFNAFYGGAQRLSFDYGAGPHHPGSVRGAFSVEFSTWSNGGVAKLQHHDGFGYILTDLPGTEAGFTTWSANGWHHLTVEMNFTNHTVRARFDNNAFTAWVPMPQAGSAPLLYLHDKIAMNLDGIIYLDNMQLSPLDSAPPSAPSNGASNPERFDYYAGTPDWAPSQGIEGWTINAGPTELAQIGEGYGETGQGLRLTNAVPMDGTIVSGAWHTSYDPCFYESQTFTMDFMHADPGTNFHRLLVSAGNAQQGAFYVEFTGNNNPVHYAKLVHWDASDIIPDPNETDPGVYVETHLPGESDWETPYVWHSLTVEMNFTNHTARAKLNDNAFTAWVPMPDVDATYLSGDAYDYTTIGFTATSGTFNLDNLWLTHAGYDCAEAIADGYGLALDVNDDCRINLVEFASLASDWLDCMEPGVGGCQTPWSP